MFNVIRIPTKYSRTINRFSDKEKCELLGALIDIGNGTKITISDTIVGDTISLIYGEWMNMEAKNGNKPEESLIQYSSEGVGQVTPSESAPIVKYSKVKDNIIKDNKELTKVNNKPEAYGNNETNLFIDTIKETCKQFNIIYKPGKQERNRIQNMKTGKLFGEVADSFNMTRLDLAINTIKGSMSLDFWRGKINNAETIYKHYDKIINEIQNEKAKENDSAALVL